jgi:hypothetical protein
MTQRQKLYVIECSFRLIQNGRLHYGLAICTDPDTPQTFLYSDGTHIGTSGGIWSYSLLHHHPWSSFEVGE